MMKIIFVLLLTCWALSHLVISKDFRVRGMGQQCFTFQQLTSNQQPGVKFAVSKSGFGYLTSVLINLLDSKIRNFNLPDYSDSKTRIWNSRVTGWTKPSGYIAPLSDRYLHFRVSNGYLKVQGKVKRRIGWIFWKTMDFTARATSFDIAMDLKIIRSTSTGQPILSGTRNTMVRLSGFKVFLSGGIIGWIVDKIVEPFIRSSFRRKIEDKVTRELINIAHDKIPKLLRAIPQQADVSIRGYHIDYRLTTDPIYGTNSFILPLNALIYAEPATRPSYPYACPAMSVPTDASRMLHVGFSQCVFNSLGYTMFHKSLFSTTLTPNLPSNIQDEISEMEVIPTEISLGCSLALTTSVACPPKVSFSSGRIRLSVTGANVTIGYRCKGSSTVKHRFSGAITFDAGIWGLYFDASTDKLRAHNVKIERLAVKVLTPETDSERLNISVQDIENLIKNIVKEFSEQKLKEFLYAGVHIPMNEMGPVKLLNARLSVDSNGIIIGTDLKIKS